MMPADFSGYVLQAARSAPSNATSTGEADVAVYREHADAPPERDFPGELVDLLAAQYRAAFLLSGDDSDCEYLAWAANTSDLTALEDVEVQAEGSVAGGTASFSGYVDGSRRVFLSGSGGRSVSAVVSVVLSVAGDVVALGPSDVVFDARTGAATVDADVLEPYGGYLSVARGDSVTSCSCRLAAPRFWWTRNDARATRFGWDGSAQRWRPYRGGHVADLGLVSESTVTLSPRPVGLVVGDMLRGDHSSPEVFATVRVGRYPDADSSPARVLVVQDDEVSVEYPFALGTDAVVGVTSGELAWNPAAQTYVGRRAWYVPDVFNPASRGRVGPLSGAPLFIAPVPGDGEYPLIRIGSRTHLRAVQVSEADFGPTTPSPGEVLWGEGTGALKFADEDVARADPDSADFDLLYLNAEIYYDGVSMTSDPVPLRLPVQLADDSGVPATPAAGGRYVPDADPWGDVSGVSLVPDGTGVIPNTSEIPVTRPNGSGLVRELGDGFLFSASGAVRRIDEVELESELPRFAFRVPAASASVARQRGAAGSKVVLSREDESLDEPVYFMQPRVRLAQRARAAKVVSRLSEPFTLLGTEVLVLSVDGAVASWFASALGAGTYTAAAVAASLDASLGAGRALAVRGRIVVESPDLDLGSVEVGFGDPSSSSYPDWDLSGCAALGFLPGWRVSAPAASPQWLGEAGISLSLRLSPTRGSGDPDVRHLGHLSGAVVADPTLQSSALLVRPPPLEDLPGYDYGEFFEVRSSSGGAYARRVRPYVDAAYDFSAGRLTWLEGGSTLAAVSAPTSSLSLGNTGVVPETLHPAVSPGFGLRVDEGDDPLVPQVLGEDFVVPQDGRPGFAQLVDVVGAVIASGNRGAGTAGSVSFTDEDAAFVSDGVLPGHVLVVDGRITCEILLVESETELSLLAPLDLGLSLAAWEVRSTYPHDTYDPGVLMDVTYEAFDPSGGEAFDVRVISPLGSVVFSLGMSLPAYLPENRTCEVRLGALDIPILFPVRAVLGPLSDELVVPLDDYFQMGAFDLLVGTRVYENDVDLLGVTSFTPDLSGDVVEYGLPGSPVEGQVRFGAEVRDTYAGSTVHYIQRPPYAGVPEGTAYGYLDRVYLSDEDALAHDGEPAYLVEHLVAERDVDLDPRGGAVQLRDPLRQGQRVEVRYRSLLSSGAGPEIIEQLPIPVRSEVATRVSPVQYGFNPDGRELSARVVPQVWVDDRMQNFVGASDYAVEGDAIRFLLPQSSSAVVRVTYGVLDAFGGERGFRVSSPPVSRPPLFLAAGQGEFDLTGDRTPDVVPGKLLRLGAFVTYVASSSYDGEVTRVAVHPAPAVEVGSRVPGSPSLCLITSVPVTDEVDGSPAVGTPGFMLGVSIPYVPVSAGDAAVTFDGDATAVFVPGHVVEIGGVPLLCAASTTSGSSTVVTLTSSSPRSFDPQVDAVRVSARPVYPANPTRLAGVGPLVQGAEFLLLTTRIDGFGRVLSSPSEYQVDASTGVVSLSPTAALLDGEVVRACFTRARFLSPYYLGGSLVLPRYAANYSRVTVPSEENGLLGQVTATYAYANPDTYYARVVPMSAYAGELSREVARRSAARSPSGGFPLTYSSPRENWRQGVLPTFSRVRELRDQDRGARKYVELYDAWVRTLEQVGEALVGDLVGDRDGKFRCWVGTGEHYAGPGYEDEFTGQVVTRLVWGDVFESANGSFGVSRRDPLVDPASASQDSGTRVVSGKVMDPWLLRYYVERQRGLIQNDVDDLLLVGKGRSRVRSSPFSFEVPGEYARAWEPGVLSRLYPERTRAFTVTYPGIGAGELPNSPGVYSFAKLALDPSTVGGSVLASTFGSDVGDLSNPSLGLLRGASGRVRERLPRARVWAYSPTGFPELDPATEGRPCVLATPLALADLPVVLETGLPDLSRLASNGGDLPDLTTGDYDQVSPPWRAYDEDADLFPQVSWGLPDGTSHQVRCTSGTVSGAFSGAFPGAPSSRGVFVYGIYSGCLITFTDGVSEVEDAEILVRTSADGTASSAFNPARGDTLYVVVPDAADASSFSDPPSMRELRRVARQQPFLDVGVRERSSSLVDRSLPSAEDPSFPIREIVNQRPASPLQAVEVDVEFTNTSSTPHKFPALLGLPLDDSGDRAVPFVGVPTAEVPLLREAQSAIVGMVQPDGPPVSHAWLSVYPNEITGSDGEVVAEAEVGRPPASLLSSSSFIPVEDAGSYVPHSGVGDVRSYDLLLIQTGQAGVAPGAQGLTSVGQVGEMALEPPRFVSPVPSGFKVRYTLENAMVHLSGGAATGILVEEVAGTSTTLTLTGISDLVLNDGTGATTGGLNGIFNNTFAPYPNGNMVTIRLLSPSTGLVLEVITIQRDVASGGSGVVPFLFVPTATALVLTVQAVGFVDFANLGGVSPGPVGPFDFTISVDTYVSGPSPQTGSATAAVLENRLTFSEAIDLSSVRSRGSETAGGVSVQGELSVHTVSASSQESDVNAPDEVNGGLPFTFLPRTSGGAIGVRFSSGISIISALGFEGHGNVPLPSSAPFAFSALPSSDQDEAGTILSGDGDVGDDSPWVSSVAVSGGALDNARAGDVLVISGSSSGDAAVTAGSYVVRHVVPDDGSGYAEVFSTVSAGSGTGWVEVLFPVVTSSSAGVISVSPAQAVADSPTGYDWDATGRIYVLVDEADLDSVVSRTYASVTFGSDGAATFTLDSTGTTSQDAAGTLIPDAAFDAAVRAGLRVSGAVFLPVGRLSSSLPEDSVVGYGSPSTVGFMDVSVTGSGTVTFSSGLNLIDSTTSVPTFDELGVAASSPATVRDPTTYSDDTAPVYVGVPIYLDFRGLADPVSLALPSVRPVSQAALRCVLPGDVLSAHDGSSSAGTGFRALSGVFVEPSTYLPVLDLGDGEEKVVDAGHSASSAALLGMRSPSDYGVSSPERVSFSVRRIRRWHSALDDVALALSPLRYVYRTRRCEVASYDAGASELITGAPGSDLGPLDDPRVGIKSGDVVRLLDADGLVVSAARVASVLGETTLRLRAPGFSTPPSPGDQVEVYLSSPVVPLEQTCAQLLDLISDPELVRRVADLPSGSGGRAPSVNVLQDSGADFEASGVSPGDIVVVDPAGDLLAPGERGAPPSGDQSVSGRPDHAPGSPSELDDNRGWYRVVQVLSATELEVTGVTGFTGPDGSPVVLGSTSPTDQRFALYPEITASGLTGTTEGQMDLRPTAPAGASSPDPSSFSGSYYSIEPFSYRVIRPSAVLSSRSADVVLSLRERFLSWLEKVASASSGSYGGGYAVFQADEHAGDLSGSGVYSNEDATSLSGLTQYAPFASSSDGLSVLDRRFWCLDVSLDAQVPPYGAGADPYASLEDDLSSSGYTVGSGRPVLPDLVTEILDGEDELRDLRYAWVSFRTRRVDGTLPSIARLEAELPRLLAEEREAALLARSSEVSS